MSEAPGSYGAAGAPQAGEPSVVEPSVVEPRAVGPRAVETVLEPSAATLDAMRALPKVLLHDHLDGGLRPQTMLDLAREVGHTLPETDADALARWFVTAAHGSLTTYLATFEHTVALLQTADALHRVAREAVEDLAADGVVAAELRYAPELHLTAGLSLDDVVVAVRDGLAEGAATTGMRVGQILCAMRQHDRSEQIAELAVRHRGDVAGAVVGFDLAGPELGYPPSRAARAFAVAREADLPCTVHAGEEGSGAEAAASLAEAVHAGACRLGHGVRLVDQLVWPDTVVWPDQTSWPDQIDWPGDTPREATAHADTAPLLDEERPDPQPRPATTLAHWVCDRGIAVEVCPSSNVATGAAASVATHPATALLRAGFSVTVNTDNRLQSGTSLSRELALLVDQAGWSLDDVRDVTLTAARSAFSHRDERDELVATITGPGPGAPGGRHRA